MRQHPFSLILVASFLLVMSGCVDERTEGSTHTLRYALWVPMSALLGGVAATIGAWFLPRNFEKYRAILFIFGLLSAVLFAPSLLLEQVFVDDSKLDARGGIWGLTNVQKISFDDLKQVRLITEVTSSRRSSKKTNHFFLCEKKDGTVEKLPINNQVTIAAAPYFVEEVSKRGIPIIDET